MSGFAALIAQETGHAPSEVTRDHLVRLHAGVRAMTDLIDEWGDFQYPEVDSGGSSSPERSGGQSRRILVVEDEDDSFHLLRSLLSPNGGSTGWEVVRAGSLHEARRALVGGEVACSLVDLGLPDSSSLDTVVELLTVSPDQPLVVVTGSARSLGVEAVRLGAQDYLVKSTLSREILDRTIEYAIERARVEARLVHQSLHDSLTGLANRALLFDRLSLAISRMDHHPSAIGLLFVDIDRFKIVNDTLGHQAGDELLVEVGRRIQARVRRADTVARVGGDEFLVLCEDLADDAAAGRIADQLMSVFSEPFVCGAGIQSLTASIGVALAESPSTSAELLVANADTAMYRAKEKGKARWELFDDEMRTRLVALFHLERELARAVPGRELELWYQPVVDLVSGRITGTEALLRWRHPERGLLLPGEFLKAADDSGQIREIGSWVLGEASAQARRWDRAGLLPDGFTMWVNVSSRQLESRMLDEPALARPARSQRWDLGLEITESALIQDLGHAASVLGRLRDRGIRIAIDDFGTGFSSLSWLHRLPIDELKIDGSFVAELGNDGPKDAIVIACVSLGLALGIGCTAEGVEFAEQREALSAMGCRSAQGYLFSRPVPAEEVPALLQGRVGSPL
ncbi:MAG TPA: EAL domain-containing protein [Acidimicrobiales bacterium]|nr:EAL domain-containing protein [Acidimicrobiales bacterium]